MSDSLINSNLRLVKDAIIQFETPDLIRIGNDLNETMVFHRDVLLFLPDFFDWCNVEQFLSTFPEGRDQVLSVLYELYEANLFDKQEIQTDIDTSKQEYKQLSLSKHEIIFYNIHNHYLMIKDYARTDSYRHAIEANVKPDDVVLEVGCGSGIMTTFAARAGAKKLFAIEINKNLVEAVAIPLAAENGVRDKVNFLVGNSMRIPAEAVDPKATIFIAELLGDGTFNEHILSYTIDARDRFLAPGARLIPMGLDVFVFAYENYYDQSHFVNTDLKKIAHVTSSRTESLYLKYDSYTNKMLSKPHLALYVDLTTIKEPVFCVKGDLEILTSGKLNGCCMYFVAHLDKNTRLSNSPWSPQLHWTQQLFNIYPSMEVKKGDKIPYTLSYDNLIDLKLGE